MRGFESTIRSDFLVAKREMEIHVTVMCGLLVIVFLIMWTPVFIVLFLVQFARVSAEKTALSSILLVFEHSFPLDVHDTVGRNI